MRVVSQKKDLSFDFDRSALSQRDECIYIRLDGRDALIAKYESHDRAAEVFKEMHEKYQRQLGLNIFYLPEAQDMTIIKTIISTLDFLFMAMCVIQAFADKDNKPEFKTFILIALLVAANIFTMWS